MFAVGFFVLKEFLEISNKDSFDSVHEWVIGEYQWSSICGILLWSWFEGIIMGYCGDSLLCGLDGVGRVVAIGEKGRHFGSFFVKISIFAAETA